MATKKTGRAGSQPRPDKYSKKRSGTVAQSLRLTIAEARVIREASAAKGQSTHYWMKEILVNTATRELLALEKRKAARAAALNDTQPKE